jgi:hypothetical protein
VHAGREEVEERRAVRLTMRGPDVRWKRPGPASPPTMVGRHRTIAPSGRGGGGEACAGRGGVRSQILRVEGEGVEERRGERRLHGWESHQG